MTFFFKTINLFEIVGTSRFNFKNWHCPFFFNRDQFSGMFGVSKPPYYLYVWCTVYCPYYRYFKRNTIHVDLTLQYIQLYRSFFENKILVN